MGDPGAAQQMAQAQAAMQQARQQSLAAMYAQRLMGGGIPQITPNLNPQMAQTGRAIGMNAGGSVPRSGPLATYMRTADAYDTQ
jgi:hypothetical protein